MHIFCITLFFYYYQQVLFALRVFSLLLPSSDSSGDIVDGEGSFQFSSKAEFTSPLYVHITIATDTQIESPCFAPLL